MLDDIWTTFGLIFTFFSIYKFFHVYDEEVLGDDWEPVNCTEYPNDSMCSGEGDFFHQHVGDANGLALDRNDMFDIYAYALISVYIY